MVFLGFWLYSKIVCGFVHAFVDNPIQRILYVVLIQGLRALTSVLAAPYARYKSSFINMIFGQIIRFVLYLFLLLETAFP